MDDLNDFGNNHSRHQAASSSVVSCVAKRTKLSGKAHVTQNGECPFPAARYGARQSFHQQFTQIQHSVQQILRKSTAPSTSECYKPFRVRIDSSRCMTWSTLYTDIVRAFNQNAYRNPGRPELPQLPITHQKHLKSTSGLA